jgi:hypothetical protein
LEKEVIFLGEVAAYLIATITSASVGIGAEAHKQAVMFLELLLATKML